jgi:membrane protease YdiL (CAAX protease family)
VPRLRASLHSRAPDRPLLALGFAVCVVGVALSAHAESLLLVRLLAAGSAAAFLAVALHSEPSVRSLLWGELPAGPGRWTLPLALAPWLACGAYYRHYLGMGGLLPLRLTWFGPVAAAIGAAEELAYRGFVQGTLRRHGAPIAIASGALLHAAYKVALFVLPPAGLHVDLARFGLFTLLGSLLLGLTREWTGGTLTPMLAHVLFDVVVYGDRLEAPSWVWR